MLNKISLKLTLVLFVAEVFASENGPEVTIKQGILRGEYRETKTGKSFSAFTGIPYAKPPVGKLRFQSAAPAGPWEGTLDATKPHAFCPQFNYPINDNVIGNEDCLYLNVYTPQLPNSNKELLPVIFYIHGGGFVIGSANLYVPDPLMNKDVVVVTINYRLGPLGFLASGTMHALGNEGLKDQVLALKWTKQNIATFGGNPESITVSGQSAGGASAHYHMLSPLSKNLIKGAIVQSGTALANWALMPHFLNARRAKILAGGFGCDTYDINEMMECLLEVDALELIKETEFFFEWDKEPFIPFKPVIEPDLPTAFLSEDPIEIITSGRAADVPLLTGLTSEEGGFKTALLYKDLNSVKEFDTNFTDIAQHMMMYGDGVAVKYRETVCPEIKKFYFGDKPIDESTKSKFTEMYGDALILAAEDAAVQLHAKYSKKPIYYYLFAHKGSSSYCNALSGTSEDFGVCHCDELLYLFNCDGMVPACKQTESDDKMSDLMTTLWANFAKHGNPTPEEDTSVPSKWEPLNRKDQNYYLIKDHDDAIMAKNMFPERVEFWRNLKMNVRTKRIRDEL